MGRPVGDSEPAPQARPTDGMRLARRVQAPGRCHANELASQATVQSIVQSTRTGQVTIMAGQVIIIIIIITRPTRT